VLAMDACGKLGRNEALEKDEVGQHRHGCMCVRQASNNLAFFVT
jgi:hypothetical protein